MGLLSVRNWDRKLAVPLLIRRSVRQELRALQRLHDDRHGRGHGADRHASAIAIPAISANRRCDRAGPGAAAGAVRVAEGATQSGNDESCHAGALQLSCERSVSNGGARWNVVEHLPQRTSRPIVAAKPPIRIRGRIPTRSRCRTRTVRSFGSTPGFLLPRLQTIEFRPSGTAWSVNTDGTSTTPLAGNGVSITVQKGSATKAITVNALGRVQGQ